MEKWKLNDYIRLFLQAIATCIGLVGLVYIPLNVAYIAQGVRWTLQGEIGWWLILYFIAWGAIFLLAAYLVFVGYLMVLKFSVGAIKHLCLVLTLVLSCYSLPFMLALSDKFQQNALLYFIISMSPLFATIAFYSLSKKLFIILTEVQMPPAHTISSK